MKNKIKILIFWFCVIGSNTQAQSGFVIDIIPNGTYTRLLPNGLVPAGFSVKTLTPSIALGLGYSQRFTSHLSASLSIYYEFNNHSSRLYTDYPPLMRREKTLAQITGKSGELPLLLFTYKGFNKKKLNNAYARVGFSYKYLNPSFMKVVSRYYKQQDTIIWLRTYNSRPASRIAMHFEVGKVYSLAKRINLDIGIRIKLGQADQEVAHEILIYRKNYNFTTLLSPSYIGICCRLNLNPKLRL